MLDKREALCLELLELSEVVSPGNMPNNLIIKKFFLTVYFIGLNRDRAFIIYHLYCVLNDRYQKLKKSSYFPASEALPLVEVGFLQFN